MFRSTPQEVPTGAVSFGQTQKESVYDYGFTQAQIMDKTCYYLVYRELLEAMDRKSPRCFITMDELCVRLIEKKQPYGEVTIFTRDIVSYYKFDHSSKFVALCIDAKRRAKSGYWFINFDTEQQLENFCGCLNRMFALEKQKSADPTRQTIQCWCCGAVVDIQKRESSVDSGYEMSVISEKSGPLTPSSPFSGSNSYKSCSPSSSRGRFSATNFLTL